MSRIPRVVGVGAGYFSQYHYRAWRRLSDEGKVVLVALCDQNEEKALRTAADHAIPEVFTDFAEMLAATGADIVDIVTSPPSHYDLIAATLARGTILICQKPYTTSLAQAQSLQKLIDKQTTTVVIHENFRFQPWYQKIAELLTEGLLGQLYQITFRLRPGDGQGANAYLDRQPYFQTMRRFLVHETAVHLIDVMRAVHSPARYIASTRSSTVAIGQSRGKTPA